MPHEVLRKILPVVGWSEDQAAAVAFTGGSDPVLPTPFRIGVAGAATAAAAGLAAAGLWQARTGRRQQVTALAVGVVHHRVEDRHPAQTRVVAVQQRHHIGVLVNVYPELAGTGAKRAVAHHGGRHDVPAGCL